jgi:hypothetical protein
MHDNVIGAKILQLCQKIKRIYKGNKNLIADITPAARRRKFIDALKPADRNRVFAGLNIDAIVEMPLVSIQPYSASKSAVSTYLTGKSTDSFWPNWTDKYPEETKASAEDAYIFQNIFGFPMDEQLSGIERAAATAEQLRKEAHRGGKALLGIE